MSNRGFISRLVCVICVVVAGALAPASAQEPRLLKWTPVPGAGGYVIEIRDASGKTVVSAETAKTSWDISRLAPGAYQYRLTTLNKLKRRGNSTAWISFSIEKAVEPVLKTVSVKKIFIGYENPPALLSGENFLPDTKVYLRKGAAGIEVKAEFVSSGELKVSIPPELKEPGIYDLVVVNRGGFESVLAEAIEAAPVDIPVIESVSENEVLHSKETKLTIKGSNLSGPLAVEVRNENRVLENVTVAQVSDTEVRITVRPKETEVGEYRITAVKQGIFRSSASLKLSVQNPDEPEIISVTPSRISKSKGKIFLWVQGRHLDDETRFELRGPAATYRPARSIVNLKSAYLTFEEKKYAEGVYLLYCEKPPYLPVEFASALTISDPSKGLLGWNGAAVGIGWDYVLPAGDWSGLLDSTPVAGHLYFSFPLKNFSFAKRVPVVKDMAVESYIDYASFNLKDTGADDYFAVMCFQLGINYPVSLDFLIYDLYFIPAIGGGAALSFIDYMASGARKNFTSLDPAVYAAAALRYVWFDYFFTDLSARWNRVLYISHPMDEIKLSFRVGVLL